MTEQSKVLTLAPNLELPLDAATRRLAILAMSGAGKSNVAVVMAEQMSAAGIPWVAIDPKGDWWGVRSSKSGKGPGLQIPIIGGTHGDVPLEPGAGKVIADLIHAQRLTCVLDVSEFDERQQLWGFLTDFGNELLRLHKRHPQVHHLFLEECDEYIPQKASEKGNQIKCLGVWQRVVKKGRTLGLGSTQITQRNASLNKDTLYMAELLVAMRVTGKGDREAIKGWVDHHNAAAEIVTSLPTLQDGEGWVTSPAWLRATKRVRFNRRHTFDSGSTPVLVEGTAPAATLADVDLVALRDRMAATIAKAKDEDPVELKKRIAALELTLKASARAIPAAKTVEKIVEKVIRQRVEVPVITQDQVKRLEVLVARIEKTAATLRGFDPTVEQLAHQVEQALAFARATALQTSAPRPDIRRDMTAVKKAPTPPIPRTSPGHEGGHDQDQATDLDRPQREVLNAAAFLESVCGIASPTEKQLGVMSGRVGSGGRWRAIIGRLRKLQLITGTTLTDEGRARAEAPRFTTAQELQSHILQRVLDGPQASVLTVLLEIYPEAVSQEELAARTGRVAEGGRWRAILGRLRSIGLITKSGPVAALPILFPPDVA